MLTELLFAANRDKRTNDRINALIKLANDLIKRIEALERQMADLKASQRRT